MTIKRVSTSVFVALVALVLVSAIAGGCATEVATRVVSPAPGVCGVGVDTEIHWGVSSGECGIRPGTFAASGVVGELSMATPVSSGVNCFWALAVDQETCEIRAGTSVRRVLPTERDEVTLTLDAASCVDPSESPAWDAVVAEIAECNPACAPSRCACGRAPSCVTPGGDCPEPLSGDLLRASTKWTCVAQSDARKLWCWANTPGSAPMLFETDTNVRDFAVGEEILCYAGEVQAPGGNQGRQIRCRPIPGSGEEWMTLPPPSPAVLGLGSPTEDVVFRQLTMGRLSSGDTTHDYVCAVFATARTGGFICWGTVSFAFPPATQEFLTPYYILIMASEAEQVVGGLAAGTDGLCAIVNGMVKCYGEEPILGFSGCETFTDHVAIDAIGNIVCALRSNGVLCCTPSALDDLPRPTTRNIQTFRLSADDGGVRRICVRRFAGGIDCVNLQAMDSSPRSFGAAAGFAVGGGTLCRRNLAALGDGSILCSNLSTTAGPEDDPAGSAYATAPDNLVCPETP